MIAMVVGVSYSYYDGSGGRRGVQADLLDLHSRRFDWRGCFDLRRLSGRGGGCGSRSVFLFGG